MIDKTDDDRKPARRIIKSYALTDIDDEDYEVKTYGCSMSLISDMTIKDLEESFKECKARQITQKDKEKFTQEIAYTGAFINVLKVLYHLLTVEEVIINRDAVPMIDIFNPNFDVSTLQFADESQITTTINNCFTLLNAMLSARNSIRQYVFKNPPSAGMIDIDDMIVKIVKRFNEELDRFDPVTQQTFRQKYMERSEDDYLRVQTLLSKASNSSVPLATKLTNYRSVFNEFSKFMEEYANAVRVYVRVSGAELKYKGSIAPIKALEYDKTNKLIGCANRIKTSTNSFVSVYDEETVTKEIYDQEIADLIKRTKQGKHIVIFGYGYSGSGKSYTLVNKDTSILHYWKNDTTFHKDATVTLHAAFELYYDEHKYIGETEDMKVIGGIYALRYWGKIMKDDGPVSIAKVRTLDEAFEFSKYQLPLARFDIDLIDQTRKLQARIAKTSNNDNSSRSHLFLVFEVVHKEYKGYLTLVDMAGREDPIDMIREKIPKFGTPDAKGIPFGSYMPINTSEAVDPKKTSGISPIVLKEGIYINETINHMRSYFMRNLHKNMLQKIPPMIHGKFVWRSQGSYNPQMVFRQPEQLFKLTEVFNKDVKWKVEKYIPEFEKETVYKYIAKPINLSKVLNYPFILFTPNFTYIYKAPALTKNPSFTHFVSRSDPFHDTALSMPVWNQFNQIGQQREKTYDKWDIVAARKAYDATLQEAKIIPVLQKLETLGDGNTQYVMMCCVRREQSYCDEIDKTLEFAEQVSSNSLEAATGAVMFPLPPPKV